VVVISKEDLSSWKEREGARGSVWREALDDFDESFTGIKALYNLTENRFQPVSQFRVRGIADPYPYDRSWPFTERCERRKVFIFRDDGESILTGKFKDATIVES
jgi:hypothetical protein